MKISIGKYPKKGEQKKSIRIDIWAFGELAKDRDPNFCIKKGKHKWVKKEGQDWSEMITLVEPVYDTEKAKAYYARKKNAFRLFGKYYENLWD